ncbi:MAG: DUF998 domain-containing protein [Candidatus Verstraetearchaeota archaeon]|jgi:hypothetical membrane protein|nr:DUF998 domain-containing protein [Candidatus Verstraetearchaeota archaeon]
MKKSVIFGICAIIVLYSSIIVSILISPWFDITKNALSDLGNLTHNSCIIFNFGLLLSGLLTILYSITVVRFQALKTSYFLILVGFSMQLVGLFCENYGIIHFYVSILLFFLLIPTSITYFIEKRCYIALLILIEIPLWILYFQGFLFKGAAIPEIISSILVIPWLLKTIFESFNST